jgi:hypothetical protein
LNINGLMSASKAIFSSLQSQTALKCRLYPSVGTQRAGDSMLHVEAHGQHRLRRMVAYRNTSKQSLHVSSIILLFSVISHVKDVSRAASQTFEAAPGASSDF